MWASHCSHKDGFNKGTGKTLAAHGLRPDELWQWNASQLVMSWFGVFADHDSAPFLLPIETVKAGNSNDKCQPPSITSGFDLPSYTYDDARNVSVDATRVCKSAGTTVACPTHTITEGVPNLDGKCTNNAILSGIH